MSIMSDHPFVPLEWNEVPPATMLKAAEENYALMKTRRTTRHFSSRPVERRLLELAILAGSTAPNGAHLQPWTWVAIRQDELKQHLRDAAETEERKTYDDRMPEAWSEVLQPLGTEAVKGPLTEGPWVVVLF